MNTLVFSDTHLTTKFDKAKFAYLSKIISRADKVIINGDFWEGYLISFAEFLKSDWQNLFPLLKKKETVYIYGNHDEKKLVNEGVDRFSVAQAYSYKVVSPNYKVHIAHGDKLLTDQGFLSKLPNYKAMIWAGAQVQSVVVKAFGPESWKRIGGPQNEQMKLWKKTNLAADEILITGHSHFAEKDLKAGFVNAGFNANNWGQYLFLREELEFYQERIN